MKVCPQCKASFPGGEQFCPDDGSKLLTQTQMEAAGPAGDPLVGSLLADRYRVLGVLGEGGMGVVYDAEHTVIEKRVALKVLRPDFSSRPDVVERFRQEAKSASRIGHENIVDISDFGETPDGASFFVMERLEGHDLSHLIEHLKVIPLARAIPIIVQCCRALGAAHAKGIVHRDMKPENIFLTEREDRHDFVKIVDFGIAKMTDLDQPGAAGKKLTKTGMIFGTPEYMSPEQAAGKATDHRVDIYAVGVILFEMLAGRVPFVGETFMAILTQHMLEPPPCVRDLNPASDIPDALEAVIARALSKKPDQRQQSMADLAAEIVGAVDPNALSPSIVAPLTRLPATPISPPSQLAGRAATAVLAEPPPPLRGPAPAPIAPTAGGGGRAALLAVGAVVVLGLAAGGGYWLFGRRAAPAGPDDAGALVLVEDAGEGPGSGEPVGAADSGAAVALEPEPDAASAGEPDAASAPADELDAGAAADDVRIAVTSSPTGAELRIQGRGVVCERTPCFFDTPRGRPVTLELARGNLAGERTLTPDEQTVLHVPLRRRESGSSPDAGRRTVPEPGPRDAGPRPPRRDAGRRVETPELHIPDFGRVPQ